MSAIVAAIQMNSGLKVADNLKQAALFIQQAVEQGAKLIVLPEMFPILGLADTDKITVCEQLGSGPIQDFLAQQASQHKIWLIGGTIPLATTNPQKIRAACLVYNDDGHVVARYDKMHLFDVQVGEKNYCESNITEPGTEAVVVTTPFGRIGLMVCFDIRFTMLTHDLVSKGAEIIAIPTAFTAITGAAHWDILTKATAILSQCYVIAACQTGTHANGRQTYGHSVIIDPWGKMLQQLPTEVGAISAAIDLSYLQTVRNNIPLRPNSFL